MRTTSPPPLLTLFGHKERCPLIFLHPVFELADMVKESFPIVILQQTQRKESVLHCASGWTGIVLRARIMCESRMDQI